MLTSPTTELSLPVRRPFCLHLCTKADSVISSKLLGTEMWLHVLVKSQTAPSQEFVLFQLGQSLDTIQHLEWSWDHSPKWFVCSHLVLGSAMVY